MKVENEFLPVYYHAEREMSVPRIGQLFKLNGALETVDWYGRGPWENYADRKTSALVGRYRMLGVCVCTSAGKRLSDGCA